VTYSLAGLHYRFDSIKILFQTGYNWTSCIR